MITPMKKVTILCLEKDKETSLETLREMGVLHVTPLVNPTGVKLNAAKAKVLHVRKALEAVPDKSNKESLQVEKPVETVHELLSVRKNATDEISKLRNDLLRFESFGNLDPKSIESLAEKGVFVKLYEVDAGKSISVDGEALVLPFGKNTNGMTYAVISRNAPVSVNNAIEMPLPSLSLAEMRFGLEKANAEIQKVEDSLEGLATSRSQIVSELNSASEELELQEVAGGMIGNSCITMIQGFCPVSRLAEIQEAAKVNGWGVREEEPSEDDLVPTLLTHKAVAKPMQFLYDIIGITPGYREIDVSAVFLAFFSLFFAIIVGDAFYGVLFLALTIVARIKMPNSKSTGFSFMYLMSGMTIVWGVLNASYLGLTPEIAPWVASLDLANHSFCPEGLKSAMSWIRNSSNMQFFCFCIAVVHLTIAHAWNIVVQIKNKSITALAQLGWLFSTWYMFFLAGNMVLGQKVPEFCRNFFSGPTSAPMIYVLIAGVVLLVLFSVPVSKLKEEWISIPMLALNIVNNFVDVISYIRLFAVGLSGAAIAESFSEMLAPMFGSVGGLLGAAVVLLLVHTLNIALAVMGVAVHAVRLNTLEFSNGLDLQWSGFNFNPFKKRGTN